MNAFKLFVIFLSLLLLCANHAQAAPKAKLWASASINRPVFCEDMTREAEITLMFVNDSTETVSLDWNSARLFINKQEIKDWTEHSIISRRPFGDSSGGFGDYPAFNRDKKEPLAAGQILKLSADFGGYFERPGTYTFSGQINSVNVTPITFRVVPDQEPLPKIVPFLRSLRAQLPVGWRVFYSPYQPFEIRDYVHGEARITIEHIAPVPMVSMEDIKKHAPENGPVVPDFGDERAALRAEDIVKKRLVTKTYKPSFTFVVGPAISTEHYRDWKTENDHVHDLISEVLKGVPKDGKMSLRPVTPEDKEKVKWSFRLHSLLHDLPDAYFGNWATYRDDMAGNNNNSGGFYGGSYHPQAMKVGEELRAIEYKIYNLFTDYADANGVVKDQP